MSAPYATIGAAALYLGDALTPIPLADESVSCVVTSPPYWGLRDYGVPGQLGLEDTPEEYVARMVEAFRDVRRVLREDGVVWLNLGDSYASTSTYNVPRSFHTEAGWKQAGMGPNAGVPAGLKPKDLVGIPWRVAFALQADGWYLRSDVIWSKPNPMPESVTDRPTKAHEYLFLLTKSARYFYDAEAVAEESTTTGIPNGAVKSPHGQGFSAGRSGRAQRRRAEDLAREAGLTSEHLDAIRATGIADTGKALVTTTGAGRNTPEVQKLAAEAKEALGGYYREFLTGGTRNRRSVWTVPTKPYPEAHFATFPLELARICVLSGCPKDGLVYDPFNGAATTGVAALGNGRRYVGRDLNPAYLDLSITRLTETVGPLFADPTPVAEAAA